MVIVVELNGGLGNQMFIYAAGFAISKRNNAQLKIDTSHLTAWHIKKKWDAEVLKLNVSHGTCSESERKKFVFKTGVRYLDMFLMKYGLFENKVYDEKNISFENFLNIREGYLRGYFTYLKYFDFGDIKEDLKKEFGLKDKSRITKTLKDIKNSFSVSAGFLLCFVFFSE